MNKQQKIWMGLCLGGFLISEILWGPIWGIISGGFNIPGPKYIDATIFSDHRVLIYLIILFETFCLVEVIKFQIHLIKEEKWRLVIIIPGILLIVFLFFLLYVYYYTRNGIGF